jgi:MFS family permease
VSRPRRLPTSLRALAHRDFRRWCAANAFSVIGTWMQVATQSWLVLKLSGSGAVLGASVALTALPSLLLGPWGGVVADRFPRRTVLIVTQCSFAALALGQAFAAFRGSLSVGLLLAAGFASGLISLVDAPTGGALGATLVPEEDLANAAALGSATGSLGRIVGMSAAGIAIALAGPGLGYAANAASYLPVILVLVSLGHRVQAAAAGPRQHPLTALRAGLSFVYRQPALLWLLVLAFVLGALGRSYQVTMALMVEGVFGAGAGGYALCSTAFAVGALAGAVIAAHLRRVTPAVVLAAGAAGAGLELAAGGAPTLPVFVALIVGAGAAAVVLDTAVSTRVATAAPDMLRGRVLAVAGAAGAGAGAVGGPVLGLLAEALGARAPLLIGGLVCLSACALCRRALTGARPARRQPVPERAPSRLSPELAAA